MWRCWCPECLAKTADMLRERDAIEAWNRRAHEYGVEFLVSNQPVVDVVEVCRCKDCMYWSREGNGYCDDENHCINPDGLDNFAKADDFCSYGERREDG